MALSVLRLRRALSPLSATFTKHCFGSPSPVVCSISDHHLPQGNPSWLPQGIPSRRPHQFTPLLGFRSSMPRSDRRYDSSDSKISPDEILFEGCDYNHWLITMDFPDDPKPTPEQMVETYVQTLTKVVGSREEAMKRMYACSTTTYTGFQAVMTEETSEKFRGLPGVVFILPDSYIDPVNKEYGGDKYEMGKITPRPPPVQYGRQGRYNDRNRNYDRPRYDRPRENVQMPGNRQFDYQGSYGQGDGRNYAPPQHNYAASQHTHNPNVQGSLHGQGSADMPAPSYNPVGRQYNQPYSPQGAAGYNPMGQQGPQGAAGHNPAGQQANQPHGTQGAAGYYPAGQQANQPHGTQGAAGYNPAGQQANQPHGTQGAAGYNPAGQQANQTHGTQGAAGYNPAGYQFNQPYGSPSSAQGNPRSYAPPQNNESRGISGFSPSTEGMNYGPNSGQYGSRHQNPVPPYQPPGGYVQGHEGGSSSGGSVAGGYHRQGPGYGQQNPGSEGYTGFNNTEKGQGQN